MLDEDLAHLQTALAEPKESAPSFLPQTPQTPVCAALRLQGAAEVNMMGYEDLEQEQEDEEHRLLPCAEAKTPNGLYLLMRA